jgi:hypothetical protein
MVKEEARQSPVRFLGPIFQKGSGGPQKPFSWLSEGVRCVFTINTEAGEIACVLHTPYPRCHPRVLVVAGAGQYCLDLSLVTVVVTLERR